MKILRSWLEEFIDLGPLRDPEKLREVMIRAGIEVASVETLGEDRVLEIEVTANRPDLLSHLGLAREIAALTGSSLRSRPTPPTIGAGGSYPIRIDSDRCGRYSGLVLRDVRIADSPTWLADRIRALGANPISNVVDATNFVLMEMNHPLHAFDLNRLEGGIIVRQATPGEQIRLLDDRTIELTADDLVIADHDRPVALAGVMGGGDSAVEATTTDLLLEAAWFRPDSIRRTARRHAVATDSSYRFERGADFEATPLALRRLAAIILETAGGRIENGIIDVIESRRSTPRIRLRPGQAARVLGMEVEAPEKILASTGAVMDGEEFIPPSWRIDLEREIDLIEEIARIAGYDRIPETLPVFRGRTADFHAALLPADGRWTPEAGQAAASFIELRARIADFLRQAGFDQSVSFSFDRPEGGEILIANPVNTETPAMRASLLPGLIRAARLRLDRAGLRHARLFELDKTFHRSGGGALERFTVAGLLTGLVEEKRYDGRAEDAAAMDHAVGVVRSLMKDLRIEVEATGFEPGPSFAEKLHAALFKNAASLAAGDVPVGVVGELRPTFFTPGLDGPAFAFEINLDALRSLHAAQSPPQYRPLPRFPAATRDLAFLVDHALPVGDVLRVARETGGALVEEARLFDIFRLKKPEGKTSVAISITLRAPDRTLTDEEISGTIERIIGAMKSSCGAELRS